MLWRESFGVSPFQIVPTQGQKPSHIPRRLKAKPICHVYALVGQTLSLSQRLNRSIGLARMGGKIPSRFRVRGDLLKESPFFDDSTRPNRRIKCDGNRLFSSNLPAHRLAQKTSNEAPCFHSCGATLILYIEYVFGHFQISTIYSGRWEPSSMDFGRNDDPLELWDCFVLFFRVSFA